MSVKSKIAAIAVVGGLLAGAPASVSEASAATSPTVEATICGEAGGAIARLYRAYFNRVPDQPGLEYWGGIFQGRDLPTVAYWMAQSEEYQAAWRGTGDREFVERLLYNNLLQRQPDQVGLDYWVELTRQRPRDEQVLWWVLNKETMDKHPVSEPAFCSGEGYSFRDIPGGRAVDVDYRVADLRTSRTRCSVASINANWLHLSGPHAGKAIGFAVVDGAVVPNTGDDASRGIFGLRNRPGGPQAEFTWDFAEEGVLNMLSNLDHQDGQTLELHSNYWIPSIFGDPTTDWEWAAGGITLMADGQITANMSHAYTFGTARHSFVAFKAPSTVTFGSTTNMTAFQLIDWLAAQGYTDIMKMDGGGSVEFNEFGATSVAGTSRPIPVWLGIGCN